MLRHTMALLENDFPYDAIMPFGGKLQHAGGELEHFCLWSKNSDLLVPENIDKVIRVNFFGMPTLVFMHDGTNKSIKTIDHAHIVVDELGKTVRLSKRYFEAEDFI